MKGIASFIWILLAFGILVIAGSKLIGIADLIASLTGSTYQGCKLVLPQFGRIECEPISHAKARISHANLKPPFTVRCGDEENSPSCDVYLYWDREWWGAPLRCCFDYAGTRSGRVCVDEGETAYLGSIPAGGYITVTSMCIGGSSFDLHEEFIPYGLNVYDSGGKFRYSTKNCNLKDFIDWSKVCKEGECGKAMYSTQLQFDDWVNYLSSWVYAPLDKNNKIVNYEGKEAYCQVNSIYELEKFVTQDGTCYVYPAKKIASVDCCPGMEMANAVCGDDFKWHPIIVGECNVDSDCPSGYKCINHECVKPKECFSDLECPGQGNFIPDYSTIESDIVRWACVQGECKVVERKQVECTPPNIGCQAGYICDIATYKCVKQEGPMGYCGDGYCDAKLENHDNCPQDCAGSLLDQLARNLKIFLASLIVSGIIILALAYLLPLAFPPLALFGFLRNKRMMLISWIALAVLLTLLFSIPMAQVASMVMQ
mgnify:CR=1 FL=1